MVLPFNHNYRRRRLSIAVSVFFAVVFVVVELFNVIDDIVTVVDAWTLFVPPSVGVVSGSVHRKEQRHGCYDKAYNLPLRRPSSSSVTEEERGSGGRLIAASRRRGGRKSFPTTALWDAYEDQYAAFLNSAAQQNQDQNQQQQQQQKQSQQQQQDMLNQHNEFQQFSASQQTSLQNGEMQTNQQQNGGSSLSSSSSSASSYPEPAYSSSIFGSGTGSGAGSYLDNLNNQQQDPSDVSPQPPPLPIQQQDTIPATSSIGATKREEGNDDDAGEKSNQDPKEYQENVSTTSFSFADLAPKQSGAITSSFTFMDTVSSDAAALLAEQLSKTQSELEKLEEEIESVTLSILNDGDIHSSPTDESATIESSSFTSGDSFKNTYDSLSKPEVPLASNRPSFTIVPPSSAPDIAPSMTSNDTATSEDVSTNVGFTYSDGISFAAPEVSSEEKDGEVTKSKDRRFRRDYSEEYSTRTPTSATVVTVEIEQLFPAGTDIMKLKDAWLDFVWNNGGGIMIPKKLQSKQQQQQQSYNDDVREFWIPFGLKQELVSVDTRSNNDGSQVVVIVYRTIRRGPFFQDFVVGTHAGTVVFDTKTEGNIVGPRMTWTVEFDVDESPPPTDWDKISERLNQKASKSFNDYLVMSSRLISTTTTKLTTKSSFWESWTASQLAIATQNFVAYVEDEYGYLLTFTVEETMPVGFSPTEVMGAWAQHCWKAGGGISLGNFATLDNKEGGKDFSKVFSILPGTIVPPLVFEKKGKKQRWIIPSLLEEEIVSDNFSIQSKDGKISYKVTNPNLFTYPVHSHRGDVEFNNVGGVRGTSIEGYSTEECTKIVWTVTVRPYRKFLGGGVKFWTEFNMRWSLRNLKLLLEDQKEAKRSRISVGRKENNRIDVVDPSLQNQERDVGRNFPKIRKFDRGQSSSSWSSSSDVPGTRPTFTIRRPNTPDENNNSNGASSKWGQR